MNSADPEPALTRGGRPEFPRSGMTLQCRSMTPGPSPKRIDLAAAAARIDAARRIVITTHARADGDAIGSAAGLHAVLRERGRTARVFLHEPIPPRYAFLTGQLRQPADSEESDEPAIWKPQHAADVLAEADLLLVLDTCAAAQLGEIADAVRRADCHRIAIDHHLTRDPVVDELLLDEQAAACAQMLTRLCDQAGWPIDARAAGLFYTGLATDTGWFRFSNAGAAAFATAARLIDAGARPNELFERLYHDEPEPRIRLIGAALASFDLLADGRLAIIRITRDMLRRCGATDAMTEDLINEPQRISTVLACVLMVEPTDDRPVRVSFRSKRDVDVAAIAQRFGGGGHARAAGARISGAFADVDRRVTAAMLEAVRAASEEHE
ncbi:MAG: bifunctional oligoribonuclease/PAP phosphatase NrnA [Phycisphaerae bacterium]